MNEHGSRVWSQPNSPRRITPQTEPLFPCELLRADNQKWIAFFVIPASVSVHGWDGFYSHWRPLSPDGPKPEQVVGGELTPQQFKEGLDEFLKDVPQATKADHDFIKTVASGRPAAPQSVREAIQKIIEDKVDSQNTLLLHPWALAERIVKAFPPADLQASADRLHAAIAVMLKDWKDGDFTLPELARIHMENVREKYQEVGRALRGPFPSPVAQQDWVKRAAKEFIDISRCILGPILVKAKGEAVAERAFSIDEAELEQIILRHAPAASVGEPKTDPEWAREAAELADELCTHVPDWADEMILSFAERYAKARHHAPHLKETGGDSLTSDFFCPKCGQGPLFSWEKREGGCVKCVAPAKDEPKEL